MLQKRTLDNSYIDFGKEKFHFRTFFSLDTLLAFVSDIFRMPSALSALRPTPLFYEKSFLIPVLKHWFFLLHSLMSEGILTSANPRQPKYLISDRPYFHTMVLDNEPGKRNGKFYTASAHKEVHVFSIYLGYWWVNNLNCPCCMVIFNWIIPWLKNLSNQIVTQGLWHGSGLLGYLPMSSCFECTDSKWKD